MAGDAALPLEHFLQALCEEQLAQHEDYSPTRAFLLGRCGTGTAAGARGRGEVTAGAVLPLAGAYCGRFRHPQHYSVIMQ